MWVQPETEASDNMGKWLQAFYATTEALPSDFLADRNDAPPEQRDWS